LAKYEWYAEALRGKGYRLTPQRVMVLAALGKREGHMSVEELYEQVRRQYAYIDLATVYRSLQLLTKLHLVAEIRTGTTSRYELVHPEQRHHHMVCEECSAAFDLPPHYLDDLKARLVQEVGFEPHMEHFSLSGLCSKCRHDQGRDAPE